MMLLSTSSMVWQVLFHTNQAYEDFPRCGWSRSSKDCQITNWKQNKMFVWFSTSTTIDETCPKVKRGPGDMGKREVTPPKVKGVGHFLNGSHSWECQITSRNCYLLDLLGIYSLELQTIANLYQHLYIYSQYLRKEFPHSPTKLIGCCSELWNQTTFTGNKSV